MADNPASHAEFEKLAVEHVLGGLSVAGSSRFRDHLIGCRHCRQRVAELRGIGSDLEVAEREERAVARTKIDTARREPAPTPPARQGPAPEVIRTVALVLAGIALAVVAFWNVHLREVRAALDASLQERAAVLDVLAQGEILDADLSVSGVRALVAVDGTEIAIDAVGLPPMVNGQRVVIWVLDNTGKASAVAFVAQGGMPGGRLAVHANLPNGLEASSLVVSIETFPLGVAPRGREVLTAGLS